MTLRVRSFILYNFVVANGDTLLFFEMVLNGLRRKRRVQMKFERILIEINSSLMLQCPA